MSNHVSTISPATRAIIRSHITESEKPIPWPYLDRNGNLTIGIGFHVPKRADFIKLPLSILKNGTWVNANQQEKIDAFDLMMVEKKKQSGRYNYAARSYREFTQIRMQRPDQDAMLDRIITTNVGRIVKSVSAKAWNQLNDQQKAAATDIAHPFGGLKKFPNLRRAIISGDAKNMAAESLFFTDRKTRARDKPRLTRNLQAILNIKETAAKAELDKMLLDIDDRQAEDVDAPVGSAPAATPPTPVRSNGADGEMVGASLGGDEGKSDAA